MELYRQITHLQASSLGPLQVVYINGIVVGEQVEV